MANTRRRSSGFELSTEPNEVEEAVETEETVAPEVFVEEVIVPTDDLGPRFVEVESVEVKTEPTPEPKKQELLPPPRRHPRNVPRFSRTH